MQRNLEEEKNKIAKEMKQIELNAKTQHGSIMDKLVKEFAADAVKEALPPSFVS